MWFKKITSTAIIANMLISFNIPIFAENFSYNQAKEIEQGASFDGAGQYKGDIIAIKSNTKDAINSSTSVNTSTSTQQEILNFLKKHEKTIFIGAGASLGWMIGGPIGAIVGAGAFAALPQPTKIAKDINNNKTGYAMTMGIGALGGAIIAGAFGVAGPIGALVGAGIALFTSLLMRGDYITAFIK